MLHYIERMPEGAMAVYKKKEGTTAYGVGPEGQNIVAVTTADHVILSYFELEASGKDLSEIKDQLVAQILERRDALRDQVAEAHESMKEQYLMVLAVSSLHVHPYGSEAGIRAKDSLRPYVAFLKIGMGVIVKELPTSAVDDFFPFETPTPRQMAASLERKLKEMFR